MSLRNERPAQSDCGRQITDPAKLAPMDQFGARRCVDEIERNRYGARFCSCEGCGLVSDMQIGGEELCVFHCAAKQSRDEMTDVLHKYRPLVILAKAYTRISPLDQQSRAAIMDEFISVVRESGFYRYQVATEAGPQWVEAELPKSKAEVGARRFVTPIDYFTTLAVAHADFAASMRPRGPKPVRSDLAGEVLAKVRSLGASWRNAPARRVPDYFDPSEAF